MEKVLTKNVDKPDSHTIAVYDSAFNLVETIRDRVDLREYGIEGYEGTHQGSPAHTLVSHAAPSPGCRRPGTRASEQLSRG